jgi:hypothetical protein
LRNPFSAKASFLDNDLLPKFGEKPEGWHPSGKRKERGLYQAFSRKNLMFNLIS